MGIDGKTVRNGIYEEFMYEEFSSIDEQQRGCLQKQMSL